MNLAASNIGWPESLDHKVLCFMAEHGFTGLEIAPARIIPDYRYPMDPYTDTAMAESYAKKVRRSYGLVICSMQSILYGQSERIIDSKAAAGRLLKHVEKAIAFAAAAECPNLVFGCPRNRTLRKAQDAEIVEEFLISCAEKAQKSGVVIALEPNPEMYHTNFCTTTDQAVTFLKRANHPALRLNLDLGTVIANGENLSWIQNDGYLIHHVHISEPGLERIQVRAEHLELIQRLEKIRYAGFVSVETKKFFCDESN